MDLKAREREERCIASLCGWNGGHLREEILVKSLPKSLLGCALVFRLIIMLVALGEIGLGSLAPPALVVRGDIISLSFYYTNT